jgi:hypothetical protein
MKAKYALLLVIAALFQFSFIVVNPPKEKYQWHELNLGEIEIFNANDSIQGELTRFSYKRGGYDLSSYTIEGDKNAAMKLFNLNGTLGNHQNQLEILNCSGNIKRDYDTITIQAKSQYSKLYLFSIEKNGIVDSLTNRIQIKLVSKTLKNEYCPNLVRIFKGASIVALPCKIKEKEIFKPFHSDKTIGIFSYFAVYDELGNVKNYPPNDYVIVGGNALSVGE